MRETVSINDLTLCHKHSDGWVRCTLPDVCKAPTIPVPFTNIAFAKDLAKGTTTVLSHDGAMCGIKGSEFYKSIGDEPGVGGGVISGVNLHRATFLSWSPNVFMEGKPVTRLTDRMLMNKGNTISAGGYYTGPVTGDGAKNLEELCEIACKCKTAVFRQACVAEKIKEKYYDPAGKQYPTDFNNGLCPEVSMIHNRAAGVWGVIMNKAGSAPTSNPITPSGGIRPDVLCRANGQNSMLVEMKFKGDELSPRQLETYPQAADDIGAKYETLDVEEHCDCSGGGGGTAPAPVTVPGKSPYKDFPIPSEKVPPMFPWGGARPAGAWCRPVAGLFGTIVYECKPG